MLLTRGRRLVLPTLLLALALGFAAPSAQAITFNLDFPSGTSTVVGSIGFIDSDEMGYFWTASRGDSVTEAFGTTGLASANRLDLRFNVTRNVLATGAFTAWDVLVNGTSVGGWSWASGDGIGTVSLSLLFPTILAAGDGDDFTIRMAVLNVVADGAGSIALGFPGSGALTGDAVPEPSTILLLGAGLAALGYTRARARRA